MKIQYHFAASYQLAKLPPTKLWQNAE